jgi:uncharacterized protein YqeY
LKTLELINQDLKKAMLNRDELGLSVLRMLKSALKNTEIAVGHELEDLEVLAVLEKQAKQRRDSADQYKNGGRKELADKELNELKIIEQYLPKKMSREDLDKIVCEVISEFGTCTASDMGKVIKLVMGKAQGAADGRMISEVVKEKLS